MDRRCCCGWGCTVFYDPFDGTPGTDLGANWQEYSGDWWLIVGDLLRENGNVGALVLTVPETLNGEQFVGTALMNIAVGDKPQIICNASDEDNYFFVELEQNAADCTLRFYRHDPGDTLLYERQIPKLQSFEAVEICFSETSFTCSIVTPPGPEARYYVCNPGGSAGGKRAGLGNGGATPITFGYFGLGNFEQSVNPPPASPYCCQQQCHCIEDGIAHCIKKNLLLTFTAGGGCSDLDGVSIPLNYEPPALSLMIAEWISDPALRQPACAVSIRPIWTFGCYYAQPQCDVPPDSQFIFHVAETADPCLDFGCEAPISVSCDPLIIVFPTFTVVPEAQCGCCTGGGWWYATITEAP